MSTSTSTPHRAYFRAACQQAAMNEAALAGSDAACCRWAGTIYGCLCNATQSDVDAVMAMVAVDDFEQPQASGVIWDY